jgi:hypothetical protein
MTSVMDVDDIILDDYIEQLQKSFVPEEDICIDVPVGYLYHINKKILWKCYRENNQFVNVIEKRPIKTCYYGSHMTNRKYFTIKRNFSARWIYIKNEYSETGENMLNWPHRTSEVRDNKLKEKYVLY